jgi:DNA-binding transcriptional regulator/RsmH inhibitor MraZ
MVNGAALRPTIEDLTMIDHLFSGSALCAVNGGGMLILPGFVRSTLGRRTEARSFLLGSHERDPCLVAYDRGYARILHQDSERRRIAEECEAPEASAKRLRRIFGFVEEIGFGDDGAIALPPMMRRRARIGGHALVIGVGGAFEIWDARAALDQADPDLREIAAFHLDEQYAA